MLEIKIDIESKGTLKAKVDNLTLAFKGASSVKVINAFKSLNVALAAIEPKKPKKTLYRRNERW